MTQQPSGTHPPPVGDTTRADTRGEHVLEAGTTLEAEEATGEAAARCYGEGGARDTGPTSPV